MLLSKSCEYAIRAVVFVGLKSKAGHRSGIPEIADGIGSPTAFTAKILQTLVRGGILSSAKGPAGGFYIADAATLYIIDVIRAIDGNDMFVSCVLGLDKCSAAQPCPMHAQLQPLREQLLKEFSSKPLSDLVADLEKGLYRLR